MDRAEDDADAGRDERREEESPEYDEWSPGPVRKDVGGRPEEEGDSSDVYAREDTITFRGTRTPDYTYPPLRVGPIESRKPEEDQRSDENIVEEARERLADDGRLDAAAIRVTVEDEVITLEGTVADGEARQLAGNLVAAVRGVRDVRNWLEVGEPREGPAGGQA